MKIDPKQQGRILDLLDNHFPDGVMALSPQARTILDRIVSQTVRDAGGPENVTPEMIKGAVEIYGEMWNEGFSILRH